MSNPCLCYQTVEFGKTDIHLCSVIIVESGRGRKKQAERAHGGVRLTVLHQQSRGNLYHAGIDMVRPSNGLILLPACMARQYGQVNNHRLIGFVSRGMTT